MMPTWSDTVLKNIGKFLHGKLNHTCVFFKCEYPWMFCGIQDKNSFVTSL